MSRDSRAWFEWVRQCSEDAERTRQTIERMEACRLRVAGRKEDGGHDDED